MMYLELNHTLEEEHVEPILRFFEFKHLPPHLAEVSSQFHRLAHHVVDTLPRNPERTVALRKLLEAKDAAVRASITPDESPKRATAGEVTPG